jgi:hypothetical protein
MTDFFNSPAHEPGLLVVGRFDAALEGASEKKKKQFEQPP